MEKNCTKPQNLIMIKTPFKKIMFITMLIILCFSCTNQKQKELASTDIIKSVENEVVEGEYRYIINKRTGKIHTYHHGMNSGMSDNNRLFTNDSLEIILQDESKDLCRTCWAGIKTNLRSYDDNALDTIEKFMRLSEFAEIDMETQKFLMCIFEVGEWYVDNVYTYLGGKETVASISETAQKLASASAQNRWQKYLETYSNKNVFRSESKIMPVAYDEKLNVPTKMVTYKCDLFESVNYPKGKKYDIKTTDNILIYENVYKNNFVSDDCSKFAAAVYYYYINNEKLKSIDYDIDLWYTQSTMFSDYTDLVNYLTSTNKFTLIKLNTLNNISSKENTTELKAGDLIYRQRHVEFYIGNNKVVNWGRIHKTYTINKTFHLENDGYHSSDPKDTNIPYTTIIRFKGDY